MLDRKLVEQRIRSASVLTLVAFAALGLRAVYVQLFPDGHKALDTMADRQYQTEVKLSPFRGTIYDHRRRPLAVSMMAPSVAVNPRVFTPSREQLRQIASLTGNSAKKIRSAAGRKNYFAWLRRHVSFSAADQLRRMQVPGLHFIDEPARYYPAGRSAAQLIGYVGLDNTGLLGLEYSLQGHLRGASSSVRTQKDARGIPILVDAGRISPESPGHNVILTLDRAIQDIAEDALRGGLDRAQARRGFAIVSDPHTGRILAMATAPGFDPNDPRSISMEHTANLGAGLRYEPGSVVKALVIGAAIEKGLTHPHEVLACEKSGRFKLDDGTTIHDDHPREFLTTEEVLVHSNNICTFKIASRLGPEAMHTAFKSFGIANRELELELPGASRGRIDSPKSWRPIRFANIAIGQGLFTTGLEIVQAYGAIANGGTLLKPWLVASIENASGEVLQANTPQVLGRPISHETAAQLRRMLARVVREGSATNAMLNTHSSAGKTGTSEKFDLKTKRYHKTRRMASFVGFAPAEDPYLVAAVVIDEPGKSPYYGGLWAAPVFREIAEKTLRYLNAARPRDTI